MKLNIITTLVAVIIAALIGLLCYYLVPVFDNLQWISFGVATVTIALSLVMAIGIDYKCGNRNTNIKLVAWLTTIAVTTCNIVFCLFCFPVVVYVVVTALISLLGFLGVYGLYKPNINQ